MSLIHPIPRPAHIRPNPSLRLSQSTRPPRWNESIRPPPYVPRDSNQRAALADQDAANLESAIERSLRLDCGVEELHFDDPPAYDEIDGTVQRKKKRKRRVMWYWVIGVIFLLVVILGATLGTQLRKST